MMNKLFLKILLVFVLIYSNNLFSQNYQLKIDTVVTKKTKIITIVTLRTVPKFILHFNGGYNSGAMELTSHNGGFSRQDLLEGKTFGVRNGFGFNLIGKIPINKSGKFWIDIVTGFDRFKSNMIASNDQEGEVAYNSINGGVGMEYNFTPTHKVKYFIGANTLISSISGSSRLMNTQDNNVISVDIKSGIRLGYSVFVGLEYAFARNIGLNLGFKFTHANLLMKDTEVGEQIPEGSTHFETHLNDDPIPTGDDPVLFAGWKQFAYYSGSVGISYFFGVKEKKYRLPDKILK